MTQQLRILQSLWAMERRRADEPEWPLQTQLAMIRDAGFDGAGVRFIDRAFATEVAGFLREQMLAVQEARRLRKSEERVRYLAHHDTLTGLINRHSIQLKLDQCVKAAEADQSSFTVLFIDLDNFKHYNDSLGHAAGDRILEVAAMRMQHQVRAQDVVGRLGGDEFIVILPGLPEEEAFQVAMRILRAVKEPLEIDHHTPVGITASIGLSRYPEDGATGEALVSRSDLAMYRVKRSGGNAFEVFSRADNSNTLQPARPN